MAISPAPPPNLVSPKVKKFSPATHFPTPVKRAAAAPPPLIINNNGSRIDLEEAIRSLEDHPSGDGRRPDHRVLYNSLVSLCISQKALPEGDRLRSHLARIGYEPGLFLENQFLNLYVKCGEVATARALFDGMPQKNTVSWNAMIAGYCSNGCCVDALRLFAAMIETGPRPNQATYLSALRASVSSGDLEHGKQIHAGVIKVGFLSQIEVANSLINMYSKLRRLEDAEMVYETMVEWDAVSWNSVIAANAQNGRWDRALVLFVGMQGEEGVELNEFTLGGLLGSKDVVGVEELHAQITKHGFGDHVYVGSALLDAYARCGNRREARLVFSKMSERNAVAWNSIIAVCVENDLVDEGVQLFQEMCMTGIFPDMYTISSLLRAATIRSSIFAGKQIHGLVVKLDLCVDALVGNTLITMYSKQGEVSDSHQVFKDIAEPDLISWNSIVQSYVENERHEEAIILFREMMHSRTEPDVFSFVSVLIACASLAWNKTGKAVHGNFVKTGVELEAFVGSALIDMYAKSAAIAEAKQVFDRIEHKDLITWNSMAVGLAQNGCLDQVLELLCLMKEDDLEPDNFTFASVLSGCADASAVQNGRQIHALILKSELNTDTAVANALITMYTKSGCMKEAAEIFSKLTTKNVVSWTAMIGGYAQSGYSEEALQLYGRMEKSGMRPNGKTFVSVLTACGYAGMTNEAQKYFKMMEMNYGISPGFEHYACMVDILGRGGRLKEAEDFIYGMPYEPNALVWRMLLSACKIHGDLGRAERSMEKILALEPSDSAAYVLLSNLYAALGKWDGVVEVRKLMKENGVRKEPGKSWIEVRNRVHEFVAGDSSHPQTDEIYSKLRELLEEMKAAGYVPTNGITVT